MNYINLLAMLGNNKMIKILKILVLIVFLTSGCNFSGKSIFGRSLFGSPNTIEVNKGDTLYSISKRYNIPIKKLAEMNGLNPPYSLMVGQTLIISDDLEKYTDAKAHRVRKGDTLYNIAKKYDVPLRDLIEKNHLSPPYSLYVGQSLQIPHNRYHVVSKGDTLYSISRKYQVDVTSLSRVNNLKVPYTISVGDNLVLPGSITSADATGVSSSSKMIRTKTKSSKTVRTPTKQTTRTTTKTSYRAPTTVSTKRATKFAWPVRGNVISKYGTIGKGRKNDGINIKAAAGTAVNAADKGTVVYAGNELKGFGNLILIKHSDGWITAYAHNERIFVRKGQSVRKGEKISAVGKTGGVNEPQLHFEVHVNKKPINPLPYLQ